METQIDSYPVASLPDVFGVHRSNIYKWMETLGIQPEKIQGKAFINADQYEQMKAMATHLEAGGTLANFPGAGYSYQEEQAKLSRVSQDKSKSLARQDSISIDAVLALLEGFRELDTDPLANLRQLQEVCDRGWLLSSSQLAPLLNRQSLPSGKEFERYGFRFIRSGKNGSESAWKVEKHG